VLGRLGAMPPVWSELEVRYELLRQDPVAAAAAVVAAAGGVTGGTGPPDGGRIAKLGKSEALMVTIGSTSCAAQVVGKPGKPGKPGGKRTARLRLLRRPVCAERGEVGVLSRQVRKQWRLVGRGAIVGGVPATLEPPAAADPALPQPP
jgi:translation initiation factor 2 gamma subunit (eIF-2gamma)